MLSNRFLKSTILCSFLFLTACGGGGSDSGGGDGPADQDLFNFTVTELIRFSIRDESFMPNQAQIDCAAPVFEENEPGPGRDALIRACIDNNP